MDAPAEIAVVIVSYNTRELLLACLASVVESLGGRRSEIVVVDNASADGSADAARQQYPHARLLRNTKNLGFGAACNRGLQETAAPLILLLNSDACLSQEAVTALARCLLESSARGAAGCRLLDEGGAETMSTRNFLTPLNQALELAGVAKLFPRLLSRRCCRRTYRPQASAANPVDCSVDWVEGACLMLKRAALDDVGGFDERFFMYSEEEDLCYRLRQRGWQVCYSAAGTATHIGGASSRLHRREMLEQFYFSQLLFLAKHRGRVATAIYKLAMKAVLAAKQVTRRSADQRRQARERSLAFGQALARFRSSGQGSGAGGRLG